MKVTGAGSGESSVKYSKVEPIVTRSVAARGAAAAAAANLHLDISDNLLSSTKQGSKSGKKTGDILSSGDIILPGLDSSEIVDPVANKPCSSDLSCFQGQSNDMILENFGKPMDINQLNTKQLEAVEADGQVKICISVSDGNPDGMLSSLSSLDGTDVSRLLVIKTKYTSMSPPRSSTGSTTDTASEVASLLSSSDACSSPGSDHSNSDISPFQKYGMEQSYSYHDDSSLPSKFTLEMTIGQSADGDLHEDQTASSDMVTDDASLQMELESGKDEKLKVLGEKKTGKSKDNKKGQKFTPKVCFHVVRKSLIFLSCSSE